MPNLRCSKKNLAADSISIQLNCGIRDHWEEQGEAKAPLDPVFEAMEDEDEAVRAKATAIVEQRWAAAHDRKKG
ncbi:MAG: hypothetical protein HP490_17430 [Nitrospira sp.]|nr:hypothetical protein [Nitrospira sp.]